MASKGRNGPDRPSTSEHHPDGLPAGGRALCLPWRAAGISEQEAIDRTANLKKSNIVRQISAIFDTRRLGYKTTLVAMRFPPETLSKSAKTINKHPGVSHNYGRTGQFNLWFTLAVPPTRTWRRRWRIWPGAPARRRAASCPPCASSR